MEKRNKNNMITMHTSRGHLKPGNLLFAALIIAALGYILPYAFFKVYLFDRIFFSLSCLSLTFVSMAAYMVTSRIKRFVILNIGICFATLFFLSVINLAFDGLIQTKLYFTIIIISTTTSVCTMSILKYCKLI